MTSACVGSGFGEAPWGEAPWGAPSYVAQGGAIPTEDPFDVYCFGPCGPMLGVLLHTEVSATHPPPTPAAAPDVAIDAVLQDLVLRSNDGQATNVQVLVAVPRQCTLEVTVHLAALPVDFANTSITRVFVGVSNAAGAAGGVFLSRAGLAYAAHATDAPQVVPDSQVVTDIGDDYLTLRLAIDESAGIVYVYATRTADLPSIGHQLRSMLPVLPSDGTADGACVNVLGTALHPVTVGINEWCLGSGLAIPNLPPIADAGRDMSVKTCSIVQLDGRRSFDPEGAALQYQWRIVDAPDTSRVAYAGDLGTTDPTNSGYTDRLWAEELDSNPNVQAGDVLLLDGTAALILAKGTVGLRQYVQVAGSVLSAGRTAVPFKLLHQLELSGAATARPTFYPDVPGIFQFELRVSDGGLWSEPTRVVLNVVESHIAKGITPDASFIWGYLSDFWNLVDDRDRIEVVWSSVMQLASAELLKLWQYDYNKSLNDIQRTFQRKWLNFEPQITEEFPDLTSISERLDGVESTHVPWTDTFSDVDGKLLTVTTKYGRQTVTLSTPYPAVNVIDLVDIYQRALAQLGVGCTVRYFRDGDLAWIRVWSPQRISIEDDQLGFFAAGAASAALMGTGERVGVRTYRVDTSLLDQHLKFGDLLVIDGVAYQIDRVLPTVVDADAFEGQRVLTVEELPLNVGTAWEIPTLVTSTSANFWEALVDYDDVASFELRTTAGNLSSYVAATVVGSHAAKPHVVGVRATDLSEHLQRPTANTVTLRSILRRHYLPIDSLIVDIPTLQERIKGPSEEEVLRRNLDFFLEEVRGVSAIRFDPRVWEGGAPPQRLWSELTYLDNRPTIEANFGVAAGFTLDDLTKVGDNVDYLSAVRGLWYAYFTGPSIYNMRVGAQILLGLPFAEETGTVEQIRRDISTATGRMLIRDLTNTEIVRSYEFPLDVDIEQNPDTGVPYALGDTVRQFAPLTSGVSVVDHLVDPRWIAPYLGQRMLFEVEKFMRFLVRVDSKAFNLPALLFAQSFVRKIKPTYTQPLFLTYAAPTPADVTVTDAVHGSIHYSVFDTICDSGTGVAPMLDQPDPHGGVMSAYDVNPTSWGYDVEYLCPEEELLATLRMVFTEPTYPGHDAIFQWGAPVYDEHDPLHTPVEWAYDTPLPAGDWICTLVL